MAPNFHFGVDLFNQVLAWRVTGRITRRDVEAIAAQAKGAAERLTRGRVKLLVDNRALIENGRPIPLTETVQDALMALQDELYPLCSHAAVLCNGSAMKTEMDRHAMATGVSSVARSFYNPDRTTALRQAYAFLGIETNEVVAA